MVSELSSCLALVRPVGMGDDAATEWLAVAANEVLGFAEQRPVLFRSACATARRECTHHGQIVPKVLSLSRCAWEPPTKVFKSTDQLRAEASAKQLEHRSGSNAIGDIAKRLTWDER